MNNDKPARPITRKVALAQHASDYATAEQFALVQLGPRTRFTTVYEPAHKADVFATLATRNPGLAAEVGEAQARHGDDAAARLIELALLEQYALDAPLFASTPLRPELYELWCEVEGAWPEGRGEDWRWHEVDRMTQDGRRHKQYELMHKRSKAKRVSAKAAAAQE